VLVGTVMAFDDLVMAQNSPLHPGEEVLEGDLALAPLGGDLDSGAQAEEPGRHVRTGRGVDDVAYHRRPIAELMGGDREGAVGEQRVRIADFGIVENIVDGRSGPDYQPLGLAPREL